MCSKTLWHRVTSGHQCVYNSILVCIVWSSWFEKSKQNQKSLVISTPRGINLLKDIQSQNFNVKYF